MKPFTADQVSLGFVGVEAMGSRIVRRLRDRGYQVSVHEALFPYPAGLARHLHQRIQPLQPSVYAARNRKCL